MISINKLTKIFGETRAVDGLNFEIPKGQILGILGPNGAGKTTTLRILTGYTRPTSGSVLINNIDVSQDPIRVKKTIGYLPESSPIYTDMLVFDYLNYIADIREITGPDKLKRLMELSSLCGIREVMHRPVSELSKGYKQRVGLALALMDDPEILVLDEPTSGLDPNQIAEIRTIIKEIGKKKTIIFSTHILSEAQATCDRVVIMKKGRLVADGPANNLKGNTDENIISRISLLHAESSHVKKVFENLPGITGIETDEKDKQLNVILTTDTDKRAEIYSLIKKEDWIILELVQEQQSLEQTFRELTKEA